jgi:hypothetical protein
MNLLPSCRALGTSYVARILEFDKHLVPMKWLVTNHPRRLDHQHAGHRDYQSSLADEDED